jgi:hypothetical protein
MTDQEINQRIAKFIQAYQPDNRGPLYKTPNGWVRDCPDYCNDLNLMHEAEQHILDMSDGYTFLLSKTNCVTTWHATARQRAQAFIELLG